MTDRSGAPAIVWTHAFAAKRRRTLERRIQRELADLGDRVRIAPAAIDCPDADVSVANAVVLAIECSGLGDSSYLTFLDDCVEQAIRRDDFRLFAVSFAGDLPDLATRLDARGRDAIERLRENVQFTSDSEGESLGKHLRAFLDSLPEIRRAVRWRTLRLGASQLFGKLSGYAQIGLAVAAGIGAPLLLMDAFANLRLPTWSLSPLALAVGSVVAPLVAICFCLAAHGRALWHGARLRVLALAGGALLALSLAASTIAMPGASPSTALLGLALGMILERARRSSYRQIRDGASTDLHPAVLESAELPTDLSSASRRVLGCLFRTDSILIRQPEVFLSYSQRSKWGQAVARGVADRLRAAGLKVFLDRDLPPWVNWRRSLNAGLARATVFVSLADDTTAASSWPAAELLTALIGRDLTGLPDIWIAHSFEAREVKVSEAAPLPVFVEALRAGEPDEARELSVLNCAGENTEAAAQRIAVAVLASRGAKRSAMAIAIVRLWGIVAPSLRAVCRGCTWLGAVAAIVFACELLWRVDSAAWLDDRGLLEAIFLAGASAMGSACLLAMADGIGVLPDCHTGRRHLLGVGGWFLLLTLWSWFLPGLTLGWGGVAWAMGWHAALAQTPTWEWTMAEADAR